MALGTDGINMGARFDKRLVPRPLLNTERVLTNEAVERLW